MNKIKFGLYIKESRMKKNYTQQELADLLFVDVSTVSKWERGVSYPDITLIPDICRVLEISEHELIASTQDEDYRRMKKAAYKYNNMKKIAFWFLNISYLVAVLTCFIVNLAVSKELSWFFIVLTSLVCAYSFFPTVTWLFPKNKNLVFIGSTFISMFLLFLTCSIYTNNYWFMIAIVAVLLGYFVILYPILFTNQKRYLSEEKYNKLSRWFLFSYVMIMFIIINLLLICIYLYVPYKLWMGLIINGGCFIMPIVLGILNLFEIGKSLNKLILISLGGIFVTIICIAIGRAIYLKNTVTVKTHNIEEAYNDIKINGNTIDINVYLSNDENKVIYKENKKITIETKVVDGVLTINQIDNRKFYDMLFDFTDFEINLYLSQELINSLSIEMSTGDIKIDKGFDFNSVDIKNSTGDIEFKSNITNNLTIKNSTGDIEIENSNIGGNGNIETKTGSIEMINVNCNKLDVRVSTGDTRLINVLVDTDFNMIGKTGNLKLDKFDATNIYVTLSTGDVKGTILSSKIFSVKTSTGSISVPETYTGGICKIETSTGNIEINYK